VTSATKSLPNRRNDEGPRTEGCVGDRKTPSGTTTTSLPSLDLTGKVTPDAAVQFS
jgi:hypothetical protein